MRLMLSIVLVVVTGASAAVLPPSLPLDLISNPTLPSQSGVATLTSSFLETPTTKLSLPSSILPDDRFTLGLATDMTILPVESALMNILTFMGIVATQDFTHKLQPRTYSTLNYRNVEITSYARTEGRFLLWGVFFAINYMVKVARFYDVKIELLWEGIFVGRMKIAVKRSMSLAGGATQDLVARSNATGSDEVTVGSKAVGDSVTNGDSALLAFNSSAALSYPPGFSVDFSNIPGCISVNRNELFLTFYTAFLHVAGFPAGSQMQTFQSVSPNKVLALIMQEAGIGCSYDVLISALLYVPRYMMEHKEFGYKETVFVTKMHGQQACVGTIIQGLVPS